MDKGSMMAEAEKTVLMYARKYDARRGADLGFDDLVQLGRMAALDALASFREGRGATFATFCRMPVETAMKNACKKMNARLSLDAPMKGEDDAGTFKDTAADEGPTPEGAVGSAEREAQVQRIVRRVVSEFKGRESVVEALVERLMEGEVVNSRFRSETSLGDIAATAGVTRQAIGMLETKLRARLAEELSDLWSEEA